MPTQFYNSLTRKKENFQPIKSGKVMMYTCGPTVYDVAHIGNFRAFMFEDLLKRYLLLKGYEVTHIMNITDVDDKTIKKSVNENISIFEMTAKYTEIFYDDLKVLKILPADKYPRAMDHIQDMIKMIDQLIKNGNAYKTEEGSVFFSIDSYKNYGQLTNIDFSQQKQSDRILEDEYTKDKIQDFVLWKGWKKDDGEVFWESPWGKGRPGWHIECSAMSTKYLGNHFDIHCGGVDNLFPHHENELAQTKCATNEQFVNYWMHCEYLLINNGKMSKSLGNVFRISDLIQKGFTGEIFRFILLNTHYRNKLNFTLDKKYEALQAIRRVSELFDKLSSLSQNNKNYKSLPDEYAEFESSLDNDLDTPSALGVLFDWIRKTNLKLDNNTLTMDEAMMGHNFIKKFNSIFDIIPEKLKIPKLVQNLANERQKARQSHEWDLSDELREQIKDLGWIVEDTKTGQKCKPI